MSIFLSELVFVYEEYMNIMALKSQAAGCFPVAWSQKPAAGVLNL
jgi:hypothetical protein